MQPYIIPPPPKGRKIAVLRLSIIISSAVIMVGLFTLLYSMLS